MADQISDEKRVLLALPATANRGYGLGGKLDYKNDSIWIYADFKPSFVHFKLFRYKCT